MNQKDNEFDLRQHEFCRYIAERIRTTLTDHEIDEDLVRNLTGDLTFDVCAIIDGSEIMEFEEFPILPKLCFLRDRKSSDLIEPEGQSWMHEYAFGVAERIFEIESECSSISENTKPEENQNRSSQIEKNVTYSGLIEFLSGIQISFYYFTSMGSELLRNDITKALYFSVDPMDLRSEKSAQIPLNRICKAFRGIERVTLKNEATGEIMLIPLSGMGNLSINDLVDTITMNK